MPEPLDAGADRGSSTKGAAPDTLLPIESGPTGERKVRTLLLFLMVLVFGLWFAYDGWIGYPAENLKEHIEQLSSEHRAAAKDVRLYDTVDATRLPAAKKLIKRRREDSASVKDGLQNLFGGPPSLETKDAIYYFGPYYRITVTLDPEKEADQIVTGRATDKTATDILFQKGLAIGLLLFAAYLLVFVLRVRSTRLVLNSEGLTYRGVGPIRWDAMRSLDISRFARKGTVDLWYDDNGVERKLRLDEYHLEKFDDIVDEICARKGFENPLPVTEEPVAPAS